MAKTIRLRLSADLRRRLKARATLAGQTLTDFVLAELAAATRRPTAAELDERLAALGRVDVREAPADAIRAGRSGR